MAVLYISVNVGVESAPVSRKDQSLVRFAIVKIGDRTNGESPVVIEPLFQCLALVCRRQVGEANGLGHRPILPEPNQLDPSSAFCWP